MGRPKSDLLSGLGTWFEIAKAVTAEILAQGGSDDDVRTILKNHELKREIVKLIIAARPGAQSKPAMSEVASLIPSGWTVVEDVPATDYPVEKMEFISFLKTDESLVDGMMMRKRTELLQGNLGLADAPRILTYLNRVKPKELQGYYIVLPGTVLRDSGGNLHVPCLGWDGGQWILCFRWLGGGWSGGDCIARCK